MTTSLLPQQRGRQAKEISHLVSGIGEFSTEAEVNTLAACHCEDQNVIQAKIDSQIDSMQEIERQEYWEWLDLMSGNHWSFHKALYSQEFSMQICVFITYHSNA